jgi:Na+/melibiose symporter-like transporter
MHKLLKLFIQLLFTWIVFQIFNMMIIYYQTGLFDLTDLKEWKPWLLTFIVFAIIRYINDRKN